jgi:hypothetical protein
MLFKRKRTFNLKLQQPPRRHACSAGSSIRYARNKPDYTQWLIVSHQLMTAGKPAAAPLHTNSLRWKQEPRRPVFVGKLERLQTRVSIRLAGSAGAAPPK